MSNYPSLAVRGYSMAPDMNSFSLLSEQLFQLTKTVENLACKDCSNCSARPNAVDQTIFAELRELKETSKTNLNILYEKLIQKIDQVEERLTSRIDKVEELAEKQSREIYINVTGCNTPSVQTVQRPNDIKKDEEKQRVKQEEEEDEIVLKKQKSRGPRNSEIKHRSEDPLIGYKNRTITWCYTDPKMNNERALLKLKQDCIVPNTEIVFSNFNAKHSPKLPSNTQAVVLFFYYSGGRSLSEISSYVTLLQNEAPGVPIHIIVLYDTKVGVPILKRDEICPGVKTIESFSVEFNTDSSNLEIFSEFLPRAWSKGRVDAFNQNYMRARSYLSNLINQ